MSTGYDPFNAYPPPPPRQLQLRVPQSKPFWTYALLGANLLMYAVSFLLGPNFVLSLGAKINQAIVDGEIWRLGTSMFLHLGVLHIGFNSYALWLFGPQVERPYGQVRFLIIYLLSGLAGSSFSFLLSPYDSVGASGAIFGLIGAMGAYLYRYRAKFVAGQSRLMNILMVAGYNLIYGFISPGIDNWAHIGGLVAGVVLGWLMAPRYELIQPDALHVPRLEDQSSPNHWVAGIALVCLGIGLAVAGGWVRWGG
ncbi:MAG: rhomboid family intramembrane serine protease [Anaerolineae bacterium]|nr:rhomboid family intramembrane serine protease [Anaerolineae bacterium]